MFSCIRVRSQRCDSLALFWIIGSYLRYTFCPIHLSLRILPCNSKTRADIEKRLWIKSFRFWIFHTEQNFILFTYFVQVYLIWLQIVRNILKSKKKAMVIFWGWKDLLSLSRKMLFYEYDNIMPFIKRGVEPC